MFFEKSHSVLPYLSSTLFYDTDKSFVIMISVYVVLLNQTGIFVVIPLFHLRCDALQLDIRHKAVFVLFHFLYKVSRPLYCELNRNAQIP